MSERILNNSKDCGAGCACGADTEELHVTGIDRRTFLSLGAYAAAAAALAACAAGGGTDATSPGSLGATVKVSDYASLASVGGVAITTLNGTPIAIVRTGTSTFITLSRICPHQGSTINQISTGFRCPNHLAQFDTVGNWVGGQRTSNMFSYSTSYDPAAGTLTIG
jgi:nitrite reductase/ring-hydroxylating ferredoxin subunit